MDSKEYLERLQKVETEQRSKTENHYRDYRNAGIAISTVLLSFISGVAYKVNGGISVPELGWAYAIATAVLIFGVFLYQVALYSGFRCVAHGHLYQLQWINGLIGGKDEAKLQEKATRFHSDSNRHFGCADKLFIILWFTAIGHMLSSGLIYFEVRSFSGLALALFLPIVVGICQASRLPT